MNNEVCTFFSFFLILILIVLVCRDSEYWYHTNILTSLMRHMSYEITVVKKLETVLNYFKEQCKGGARFLRTEGIIG